MYLYVDPDTLLTVGQAVRNHMPCRNMVSKVLLSTVRPVSIAWTFGLLRIARSMSVLENSRALSFDIWINSMSPGSLTMA